MVMFVNLTPYGIAVETNNPDTSKNERRVFHKSDHVAKIIPLRTFGDISEDNTVLFGPKLEEVINLPKEKEDVLLIVSEAVKLALPTRHDLVSPGELLGCQGFITEGQ